METPRRATAATAAITAITIAEDEDDVSLFVPSWSISSAGSSSVKLTITVGGYGGDTKAGKSASGDGKEGEMNGGGGGMGGGRGGPTTVGVAVKVKSDAEKPRLLASVMGIAV